MDATPFAARSASPRRSSSTFAAASCSRTHGSRPRRLGHLRPQVRGDPALEAEAPEDEARRDRDEEPARDVQGGDLPPEDTEQQNERDLVHDRRRDEEREGDAKRDAALDEPDEERHGRARAERGHDPEERGEDVPHRLAASGENGVDWSRDVEWRADDSGRAGERAQPRAIAPPVRRHRRAAPHTRAGRRPLRAPPGPRLRAHHLTSAPATPAAGSCSRA
jgi:hypothetical protein